MIDEAYWVNQTHFWGADPEDTVPDHPPRAASRTCATALGIPARHRQPGPAAGLPAGVHAQLAQPAARSTTARRRSRPRPRRRRRPGHRHTAPQRRGDGDGTEVTVRAKYVVGCDGAHSVVRESIGRRMRGPGRGQGLGRDGPAGGHRLPRHPVQVHDPVRQRQATSCSSPARAGICSACTSTWARSPPTPGSRRRRCSDEASGVLAPYTLDVKRDRVVLGVPGRPQGDRQVRRRRRDDVGTRAPRVFIAGDACHTHTAKAGQGMNVSMQDTYNLGGSSWRCCRAAARRACCDTYSRSASGIAEDLIATDTRWSKAIGGRPGRLRATPQAALMGWPRCSGSSSPTLDFTAGMATHYAPACSPATTPTCTWRPAYAPGRRFNSAEVIRLSDAKRDHLGHVHRADGRWRLYAFADAVDPRNPASRLSTLMDFLAGPNSPVAKYTPHGLGRRLGLRRACDPAAAPPGAGMGGDARVPQAADRPAAAWSTTRRSSARCPTATGHLRPARDRPWLGALVVVRPDQYVSLVLPLDGYEELDEFFAGFMTPA